MQGLKSAILAIFQNGLGWLCPVSAALKNPSQESKNYFCFGENLFLERLKGKSRKGPFMYVNVFNSAWSSQDSKRVHASVQYVAR